MKLTKAIEALQNGNYSLNERIRIMSLQAQTLQTKLTLARKELAARGDMLDAMNRLQAVFPKDETIEFVVPGEYE